MTIRLLDLAEQHLKGMNPENTAAEWLVQKTSDVLSIRQAERMFNADVIRFGTAADILTVLRNRAQMEREVQ